MSGEAGARVFAVRNDDASTVWSYGLGVLVGDRRLPGEVTDGMLRFCEAAIRRSDRMIDMLDPHEIYGGMVLAGKITEEEAAKRITYAEQSLLAQMDRPIEDRAREAAEALRMNPLIKLDKGGYVWGCECWWYTVEDKPFDVYVAGRQVVELPAPHADEHHL